MDLPFVSVILPVRNEESSIQSCLEAVLYQEYPREKIEVIVADGGSKDRTPEIISRLKINHPYLELIDNPGKIVSTGLNRALLCAKGDVIVRVDGHTIIAPDYVKECVLALQRSGADNAGGRMCAGSKTAFGQAVTVATSTPFGIGNAHFHYSKKEEWVDTVYLGAWKRDVFQKIGLFDEEMVRDQDDEFNYRLREAGGKILLSSRIKSKYTVRSTPKSLWKQYYQYGFWKVRVLQKHPRQMSLRQFIPPAFVVSLLTAPLISFVSPPLWFVFPLLLFLYLTANLSASITAYKKILPKDFWFLPISFAILHLSYGTGFLIGLMKFANRWSDRVGKVPVYSVGSSNMR